VAVADGTGGGNAVPELPAEAWSETREPTRIASAAGDPEGEYVTPLVRGYRSLDLGRVNPEEKCARATEATNALAASYGGRGARPGLTIP